MRYKRIIFLESGLRKLIILTSSVFYLPIMILLMISFKYSLLSQTIVDEYNENIQNVIFPGSLYLLPIVILIFFLQTFAFYTFCYEIRHTYAKFNQESRSHSVVEAFKSKVLTVMIVFFVFYSVDHLQVFRALVGVCCVSICIKYLEFKPFYSNFVNIAKVMKYACVTSFSVLLLFGYLGDNENYPFLLLILVEPVFIIITAVKANHFVNAPQLSHTLAVNMYQFEYRIRRLLFDPETNYKNIIEAFSDAYKSTHYGKDCLMTV